MVSVTFFGTGSGIPTGTRFHSSAWVDLGGEVLLVDAGEPCSNRILAHGLEITRPTAVLISHAHSDHIAGLPMFLQGSWLAGRSAPLTIFMPGALIEPFHAWLDAVYIPPRLLGFPIEFVAWESSAKHFVGRTEIQPTPTTHLDGLCRILDSSHPERFQSYAFAIRGGARRIVFSGDIGMPADLDPLLESACDLLVCELSHFPLEELHRALLLRSVRRLALTHLSPKLAGTEAIIERETTLALPEIECVRIISDGEKIEL
jgi:ribonuclease BN (tRNA processing enzyme)